MANMLSQILKNSLDKNSNLPTDVKEKLFVHSLTAMETSADTFHKKTMIEFVKEVQVNPVFSDLKTFISNSPISYKVEDKSIDAQELDFETTPANQLSTNSQDLDFGDSTATSNTKSDTDVNTASSNLQSLFNKILGKAEEKATGLQDLNSGDNINSPYSAASTSDTTSDDANNALAINSQDLEF